MKKLLFKSPWDDTEKKEENIFTRKRPNLNLEQFPKFSPKIFIYILVLLFVLWLGTGIYEVNEGQQAAVTRFGKFVRIAQPGLNYKLPTPIESIFIENVNKSRRVEVGYRSVGQSVNDNPNESIMLTRDENILKLHCDIMWHISSLPKFIFNVANPEHTVRAVAQSVIREVISRTPIFNALSDQKQEIADTIHELVQNILNNYNAGIAIEQVQLLKVEPPEEVISAYRDVQTSRSDKEREINQAQSYRNDIIPNARGNAAQMLQQAEGYKREVVSKAEGDVQRFNALYVEYVNNKQVMRDRLMLEAVESIMKGADKTVVGEGIILPHMQLKEFK